MNKLLLAISIKLFLSVGVLVYFWMVAEREAAYRAGQQAVYASFAEDGTEGTPYTPQVIKYSMPDEATYWHNKAVNRP